MGLCWYYNTSTSFKNNCGNLGNRICAWANNWIIDESAVSLSSSFILIILIIHSMLWHIWIRPFARCERDTQQTQTIWCVYKNTVYLAGSASIYPDSPGGEDWWGADGLDGWAQCEGRKTREKVWSLALPDGWRGAVQRCVIWQRRDGWKIRGVVCARCVGSGKRGTMGCRVTHAAVLRAIGPCGFQSVPHSHKEV